MFQKFFTKTIESKFIKNILYNTPTPMFKSVRDGDYILGGINYVYKDSIIRCLSESEDGIDGSGIIGEDGRYKMVQDFVFGKYYPKFTERYFSEFGYYDSETHRYLGNYLRLIRDLYDVDLMPFYNCCDGDTAANFQIMTSRELRPGDTYTENFIIPIGRSMGDVNGDGDITDNDAQLILEYCVKLIDLDAVQKIVADVDGNLVINEVDASYVLKMANPSTKKEVANFFKDIKKNWIYDETTNLWYHTFTFAQSIPNPIERVIINSSITYQKYEISNNTLKLFVQTLPQIEGNLTVTIEEKDYKVPIYNIINTPNTEYRVYKVPINFNRTYTIALDSECEILMAPALISDGVFVKTFDKDKKRLNLTEYLNGDVVRKNWIAFNQPFTYSVSLKREDRYSNLLALNEKNLYLLIQVPITDVSSLVVLEGDYTHLSSKKIFNTEESISTTIGSVKGKNVVVWDYPPQPKPEEGEEPIIPKEIDKISDITVTILHTAHEADEQVWSRIYYWSKTYEQFMYGFIKDEEISNKRNTPDMIEQPFSEFTGRQQDELFLSKLSLLKVNDKNIYAFCNRLVEFLTLNVINPLDDLDGNIKLVQDAQGLSTFTELTYGVWSDKIRRHYYKVMMNNNDIEHYDLTGYIDRDVEKQYIK